MKGYKEFAEKHGLVLTSQKVSERKDKLMDNAEMDHWDCTLMYEGSTYGFYFSKGFGHKGAAPTMEEILDCFKSDLAYRDLDFEEFCEELGYNNDSIKDKKIYEATTAQNEAVIDLLGEDLIEELLEIED